MNARDRVFYLVVRWKFHRVDAHVMTWNSKKEIVEFSYGIGKTKVENDILNNNKFLVAPCRTQKYVTFFY